MDFDVTHSRKYFINLGFSFVLSNIMSTLTCLCWTFLWRNRIYFRSWRWRWKRRRACVILIGVYIFSCWFINRTLIILIAECSLSCILLHIIVIRCKSNLAIVENRIRLINMILIIIIRINIIHVRFVHCTNQILIICLTYLCFIQITSCVVKYIRILTNIFLFLAIIILIFEICINLVRNNVCCKERNCILFLLFNFTNKFLVSIFHLIQLSHY